MDIFENTTPYTACNLFGWQPHPFPCNTRGTELNLFVTTDSNLMMTFIPIGLPSSVQELSFGRDYV